MTHFNLQSNPSMQLNEIYKKTKDKAPQIARKFGVIMIIEYVYVS